MMNERLIDIKQTLLTAFHETGLWNITNPAWPLPDEAVVRGDNVHLAYLTLVYTISGGRDPAQIWAAAQKTFVAAPELFQPQKLAYTRPDDLIGPLQQFGLIRKARSEATVWQRIGQALVMRAEGLVSQLLEDHGFDAGELWRMLQNNKTTFPVLSGPQTGPRWLNGLAVAGERPLTNLDRLVITPSPAAQRALDSLAIPLNRVSTAVFDPLDWLGRQGCRRRARTQPICPVAAACPVADYCRFGYASKAGA